MACAAGPVEGGHPFVMHPPRHCGDLAPHRVVQSLAGPGQCLGEAPAGAEAEGEELGEQLDLVLEVGGGPAPGGDAPDLRSAPGECGGGDAERRRPQPDRYGRHGCPKPNRCPGGEGQHQRHPDCVGHATTLLVRSTTTATPAAIRTDPSPTTVAAIGPAASIPERRPVSAIQPSTRQGMAPTTAAERRA